jgi:DNA-directed RNA polymerase specialized sigma24 family protein
VPVVPLDALPDRFDPRPDLADTVSGRKDLAQALAELPPSDRTAVLLVDGQGFDYANAGEVLDPVVAESCCIDDFRHRRQ